MTWNEAMEKKHQYEDALDILHDFLEDFLDNDFVSDESYEKVEIAYRGLKKEYDSFLETVLTTDYDED